MGDSLAVLYSSASVEWATPSSFFADLNTEFGFTLDACAQEWGQEVVFCNPPYGRGVTGRWLAKAWEASQAGATVVLLIPARTDTAWWHDYAARGEVRFLRGRLKFERPDGSGDSAPFPSAVVIFKKESPDAK